MPGSSGASGRGTICDVQTAQSVRSVNPPTARSRSPPYRPAGCRRRNRAAACANRAQAFQRNTEQPSRRVGLDLVAAFLAPAIRHSLHHTISRTRAAAALPSVIGEPGSDFIVALIRLQCGSRRIADDGAPSRVSRKADLSSSERLTRRGAVRFVEEICCKDRTHRTGSIKTDDDICGICGVAPDRSPPAPPPAAARARRASAIAAAVPPPRSAWG